MLLLVEYPDIICVFVSDLAFFLVLACLWFLALGERVYPLLLLLGSALLRGFLLLLLHLLVCLLGLLGLGVSVLCNLLDFLLWVHQLLGLLNTSKSLPVLILNVLEHFVERLLLHGLPTASGWWTTFPSLLRLFLTLVFRGVSSCYLLLLFSYYGLTRRLVFCRLNHIVDKLIFKTACERACF